MAESNISKYLLFTLLGAVGGGITVHLVSKAVPKVMPEVMKVMMLKMKEDGHDTREM